jgi:hypothetical protein
MLDVFRAIKDYDTIFFTPNLDSDEGDVKIEVAHLKERGEKIGGSEMGDMFDIVLFRLNEEDDITDLERFEGILIDARVYVSRMVKESWYGMVSRKTTTSNKLTDSVFANWLELCNNKE